MIVPVLYKISTLVDILPRTPRIFVPVLYKISTLVDFLRRLVGQRRSRSLQNFYSCRSLFLFLSDKFPFFTKFLLL